MKKLYHVSVDDSIERFEPRPPPSLDAGVDYDAVWAIDEAHIMNYLLPRDCPRVTYYRLPESHNKDIEVLIGPSTSKHIVAIEDIWFERALKEEICIYEFNSKSFSVVDSGAGYFVSREIVFPIARRRIANPLLELISLDVELRVLKSLWPLRDRVIESTLQFSCIRMRNAKPRKEETEPVRSLNSDSLCESP